MCDQDHSKEELEQYEARGLVTRKQFGVMLGAGIAMMLPKVANAAAVTESDVTIKTPDGSADCYFVHPATGPPQAFWCGRTSSGCGRRSARWASGSPNRAIRYWW